MGVGSRRQDRPGNGRQDRAKPRGRLYRWFERTVLSFGMGIVASFAERRLIKAMKRGGLKPAPRTAAGHDELPSAEGFDVSRSDELAPSETEEVSEQP